MYKIVIIDDEKLLRQGFIHITNWSEKGYLIVGEASNGVEALQLIERTHPDIIVTDIRMPVMDGIELTKIVRDKYPYIQIIILSSYNEFDYVKSTLKLGALDYILKQEMEVNEIFNVLEKAKARIKEINKQNYITSGYSNQDMKDSFLNSLVTNSNLNVSSIKSFFIKYGIQLSEENMLIAIACVDQESLKTNSALTGGIASLKNKLTDSINVDSLLQKQYHVLFTYENNMVVLMLNCPQSDLDSCKSFCRNFAHKTFSESNLSVKFFIGTIFNHYTEIYENFHKTSSLSQYLFYKVSSSVLCAADFNQDAKPLDLDFKKLNSFIEILDFKSIKSKVTDMIAQSMPEGTYIEPYTLKKYFTEICYYIIHKLADMGISIEPLNKAKFEYFKSIENSYSYDELMAVFINIIDQVEQMVSELNENRFSPIIKKVLDYIEYNYQQEISLSSIAECFHSNKSYLCDIFKQQTGENMNNFITNVRINKAKEMLRGSEYNVNIIGSMVGYSNPSYFSKVFKKVVGMTPFEYHKIYNK